MEIDKDRLLELESEYEISFSTIMRYYTLLMSIPCVKERDEEQLYLCLETLIQDRVTTEFKQEEMNRNGETGVYKSLEYSVSDALYRIYEDEAIPYLCDEYKAERNLSSMSL